MHLPPIPRSQIVRVDGRPRLLVDGRPFLILGLQWDCDSCFSAADMNPLFPHAARMGANTAVLPVYWREVEPTPDRYDFAMVDERLAQARQNGLRLILLWFATWKNACPFYAPAYIRDDPAAYPRALDRSGRPTVSLCPSYATTWQRDRAALCALMAHLRDVDDPGTVIMLQLENEPGLLGTDRCYCEACETRFRAEGWAARGGETPSSGGTPSRGGADAAERFSTVSIARYIDRLAAEARAVYPLPLYVNVWLSPAVGGVPGRDYPSGGAVPQVLDLARETLAHVDLVAPDIYGHGYRNFQRLCQVYGARGNPLYIAEHSSSPTGRAERNVFYALGEYAAIGFDPWAIDAPFPERTAPPLADPVGGEWGPQAYWLRDSYVTIGRAMEPIVEAQGTPRLFSFVQEAGESGVGWATDGCDVLITYDEPEGMARGMVIRRAVDEFLVLGVAFSVRFARPRPDGRPVPIVSAEWGQFEGERWLARHPMRRERLEAEGRPLALREPGVARVILAL